MMPHSEACPQKVLDENSTTWNLNSILPRVSKMVDFHRKYTTMLPALRNITNMKQYCMCPSINWSCKIMAITITGKTNTLVHNVRIWHPETILFCSSRSALCISYDSQDLMDVEFLLPDCLHSWVWSLIPGDVAQRETQRDRWQKDPVAQSLK
jgi:hypothetical protein